MIFFLQQSINGVSNGGVFALYALGFGLVIANFDVFHVAHAAIFTWGAVVAWEIATRLHAPIYIVLPVAALAAGLLNALCYVLLIRHLEAHKNKQMNAFISSLGGLIALSQAAAIVLGNQTVSLPTNVLTVTSWRLGSLYISSIQALLLGVAIVGAVALSALLHRTNVGRQIRAVAYDRKIAGLLGTNVDRISALVFFISGVLAGASATLIAIAFNDVDSQVGSTYLILALAAMVVGGFGSVAGMMAGGFLIGLANSYTVGYLSSGWSEVIVFGLMLVFLIVRPTGLFGRRSQALRI
jgi:branched-chain amino acid transport system permease protein